MFRRIALIILVLGIAVPRAAQAQYNYKEYVSGQSCTGSTLASRNDIDFSTAELGAYNTGSVAQGVECPLVTTGWFFEPEVLINFGIADIYVKDGNSATEVVCEFKVKASTGSIYYTGTETTTGTGYKMLTTNDLPGNQLYVWNAFIWCTLPAKQSDYSGVIGWRAWH